MGFTAMTEVQEKAIPVMMSGREIIAKAPIVQHHGGDLVHPDGAVLHVVQQPPGGGHHDLRVPLEGGIPVMVATDVAARGIDVTDIDAVINYDFPALFSGWPPGPRTACGRWCSSNTG